MTSPTFCASFADGVETRMTCWHSEGRKTFDVGRGIRLSHAAYITRARSREHFDALLVVVPPPIISAHFEEDGVVLEQYDTKQLAEAAS